MKSKPGRYGIENQIATAVARPGYWKTLVNLRKDTTKVELRGSALYFSQYAFEPASIFPAGMVGPGQITEVNLGYPCQVRLTNGEILFVPQACKETLLTFINRYDVPVQRRSSVWSGLLDPFLDTWEEQDRIDRQFEWFASVGLNRQTVTQWRSEVALAMTAYNFGTRLWEWGNFDLYDALTAQRARLGRTGFGEFYSRAMHLTTMDPVSTYRESSSGASIDGALFSVLLDWYPREKSGAKSFWKKHEQRRKQIDAFKTVLFTELTAAYSETHRRYRTPTHIEHCLGKLNSAWDYAVHLHELRWALLFHDAIYDTRRHDNEERSAAWACQVMTELGRPEDEKARVRGLILATAHAREPATSDEALLLDILSSFLGRERLYHTALYRARFEETARRNLQRTLE